MNATVTKGVGGHAKFQLGQTVMTPGVQELVAAGLVNPVELLRRHQAGDWGELDKHDVQANEQSLRLGERLLSSYQTSDVDVKVWVITEADRSSTCLLLPSEY